MDESKPEPASATTCPWASDHGRLIDNDSLTGARCAKISVRPVLRRKLPGGAKSALSIALMVTLCATAFWIGSITTRRPSSQPPLYVAPESLGAHKGVRLDLSFPGDLLWPPPWPQGGFQAQGPGGPCLPGFIAEKERLGSPLAARPPVLAEPK
jgi:hypothetical protein